MSRWLLTARYSFCDIILAFVAVFAVVDGDWFTALFVAAVVWAVRCAFNGKAGNGVSQ